MLSIRPIPIRFVVRMADADNVTDWVSTSLYLAMLEVNATHLRMTKQIARNGSGKSTH